MSCEVRKQVHELVAQLLGWSLEIATAGTFPSRGFHDEDFGKSTLRYKKQGKQLAHGWR